MPPENNDERLSALGKARERLYSPSETSAPVTSVMSQDAAASVPHSWVPQESRLNIGAPHHVRFASWFFALAIVFFIVAIGAAFFLFYTGGNTVSVDNIELSIKGPITVAGGDIVPLAITITNKNPSVVDAVTLEFAFPEGTRSATDVTSPYPRFSESLGALEPGQTVERTVPAVFFGEQGAQVVVQASVSFKTSRSNAVFVKPAVYPITISTAPLSVSVDSVSETVSGQAFTIRATVRSNATQPIGNVVLLGQYPAGYLIADSSVTPVGTLFPIGALKPGGSKTVTITGILSGQNNDERIFRFTVGTARSQNDPELAVGYMTQETKVMITAPFLSTAFTINGSSTQSPAVAPGALVTVGISWVNALPISLNNAEIRIALDGAAIDLESVRAYNGFYRSFDRTIIFSRDTDPTLTSIAPKASGLGTFTFSTLANAPRNSAITLAVSIAGERTGQTGSLERITSTASKTIKLVSATTLTATSLHSTGPFQNVGPIPPTANLTTGYTVRWVLANPGNDLAGGVVSATLPIYTSFSGATSPNDGSITFDESSRRVTWQVGDVSGGGFRQGEFQVLLIPSTSQRGSTPALTSAPTFSAFDRYAQVQVTTSGQPATTETPGDPGYTFSKASVQ